MRKKFTLSRPYNWLIFKIINPQLEIKLKKYAFGKLLDIGCGEKPYKYITNSLKVEHIGLDLPNPRHGSENVDIEGTAYNIPVGNNSFDTILCTDVLEHLEEPSDALKESYRVLNLAGTAIYTVPMTWHLHEEPRDFYRFTKYGLEYLFKKAGFNVVEIVPLSGFWVSVGQASAYYFWRFTNVFGGKWNPFYWIVYLFVQIIQVIALFFNKIHKAPKYCTEYLVVAQKK